METLKAVNLLEIIANLLVVFELYCFGLYIDCLQCILNYNNTVISLIIVIYTLGIN